MSQEPFESAGAYMRVEAARQPVYASGGLPRRLMDSSSGGQFFEAEIPNTDGLSCDSLLPLSKLPLATQLFCYTLAAAAAAWTTRARDT